jgi:methionyl aminopeptidase
MPADLLLPVRTRTELDAMGAAGRVVARTLRAVAEAAAPGVRLRELDDIAQTCIREAGALPSFLGYAPSWAPTPYNGVLCLSPNEVVVHGRPSPKRLREGDLLSIDCGAITDGWHGDAAITIHIGPPAPADTRLVEATERALAAGITAARPGATLLDIARAVDAVARDYGYAHLPDHGGHGIGRSMHEPPMVPNQPTRDARRHRLRAGNTLAIEPMLHAGTGRYRLKKDGWSIVTADGKRAAHVEHTIAVTDDGPLILTTG